MCGSGAGRTTPSFLLNRVRTDFVGDFSEKSTYAGNLIPFLVGRFDAIFRRNMPVSINGRNALAT